MMFPYCEQCGTFHAFGACDLVQELRARLHETPREQLSWEWIRAHDGSCCAFDNGFTHEACEAWPEATRNVGGIEVPACKPHAETGGNLNRQAALVWRERMKEMQ